MGLRRHSVRFSLFAFQDIITGLCGVLILIVLTMSVDLSGAREVAVSVDIAEDVSISIEDLRKEVAALEKSLEENRNAARKVVVAVQNTVAPAKAARLVSDMDEKERELAALVSQVEDLRTLVAAAKNADGRDKNKVREMEETRRILEKRLSSLRDKKGITLIPERGMSKIPVYIVCGRDGVEILRMAGKSEVRRKYASGVMKYEIVKELLGLDHTTHTVILLVRPSGVDKMTPLAKIVRNIGFTCGRDPLEEDVKVSLVSDRGGT